MKTASVGKLLLLVEVARKCAEGDPTGTAKLPEMDYGAGPEDARLLGDLVQFAACCSLGQPMQHMRWDKVGFSQPRDETVAAVKPINRPVERRRDGVQEIEAERVGNEICRRSGRHDSH